MFKLPAYYLIFMLLPLIAWGNQTSNLSEYEYAKKLISENCYDCRGSSKEKLEEGVILLEKFFDKNTATADQYLLLSTAYRDLALTYHPHGSDTQKELLQKEKRLLEKMIELEKDNVQFKILYSDSLRGKELVSYLEKISLKYPNNAEIHFMLGKYYLRDSYEDKRGIDELQKAYDLEESEHRRTVYGRELGEAFILYEHFRNKSNGGEKESEIRKMAEEPEPVMATSIPLVDTEKTVIEEKEVQRSLDEKGAPNNGEYFYVLIFFTLLGGFILIYFLGVRRRK